MATRRTKPERDPWPLGAFLREQRGDMSIRGAARRADISESRWRQIEAGYQLMAGGIKVDVHPRAETLVAMSRAISADPTKALQLAGYDPAKYAWLLEPAHNLGTGDLRDQFGAYTREEREQILADLQRMHVDLELQRDTRRKRRA